MEHGISNTESKFIEDIWAKCTESQSSFISSNIKKNAAANFVLTTLSRKTEISGTRKHITLIQF